MLIALAMPIPTRSAQISMIRCAGLVSLLGGLDGLRSEHRLALGLQPSQRGIRMRIRGLTGKAVERVPRGRMLE